MADASRTIDVSGLSSGALYERMEQIRAADIRAPVGEESLEKRAPTTNELLTAILAELKALRADIPVATADLLASLLK